MAFEFRLQAHLTGGPPACVLPHAQSGSNKDFLTSLISLIRRGVHRERGYHSEPATGSSTISRCISCVLSLSIINSAKLILQSSYPTTHPSGRSLKTSQLSMDFFNRDSNNQALLCALHAQIVLFYRSGTCIGSKMPSSLVTFIDKSKTLAE